MADNTLINFIHCFMSELRLQGIHGIDGIVLNDYPDCENQPATVIKTAGQFRNQD